MAAGLLSSDKSLTDDEVLVKELMIITIDNLVKEHLNLDSKADLGLILSTTWTRILTLRLTIYR